MQTRTTSSSWICHQAPRRRLRSRLATTEFIHNTIVCRPRLLQATLNLPFAGARAIKPVVEPIPTGKPGEAFKQARVTITKASLDGADAAGFILALGWHDPNLVQAKTVRVAKVSFSGMEGRLRVRDNPVAQLQEMFKEELDEARAEIARRVAGIRILGFSLNDIPVITNPITNTTIDLGGELKKLVKVLVDAAFDALLGELAKLVTNNLESEEWLMRYGVNGRWETRYFHEMTNKPFALKRPAEFEVSLGPDDVLFFTTSGVELNPVGDMMRAGRTERELKLADSPALTWNEIVTATGNKRRDIVFRFKGNSKGPLLALGIENTPLGIVDPNSDRADFIVETSNPLIVSKADLGSVSRKAIARFARATGEECILVEEVQGNDDYRVNMLIQISNQVKS
ncbi:MAG: hypothetical protein SGI92_19360 [Bryobacteraceae bacterium]|nr:hypothetical protein [Bryobacteraceae bacterium]